MTISLFDPALWESMLGIVSDGPAHISFFLGMQLVNSIYSFTPSRGMLLHGPFPLHFIGLLPLGMDGSLVTQH